MKAFTKCIEARSREENIERSILESCEAGDVDVVALIKNEGWMTAKALLLDAAAHGQEWAEAVAKAIGHATNAKVATLLVHFPEASLAAARKGEEVASKWTKLANGLKCISIVGDGLDVVRGIRNGDGLTAGKGLIGMCLDISNPFGWWTTAIRTAGDLGEIGIEFYTDYIKEKAPKEQLASRCALFKSLQPYYSQVASKACKECERLQGDLPRLWLPLFLEFPICRLRAAVLLW